MVFRRTIYVDDIMAQRTQKLAILFADICDSTKLYDSLGDVDAHRLISRYVSLMTNQVVINNGTLIKTIGDEIMCSFVKCEHACNAARAIQSEVVRSQQENKLIKVRIGFHFGDVLCEDGDVYGSTVNVSARIAEMTRANQILTTQDVVSSLPPELLDKTHKIMRSELRGKPDWFDIFQIAWKDGEMDDERLGDVANRARRQK